MRGRLMIGAVCATAAVAMPATAPAHDRPSGDAPAGTVSAFAGGALTIALTDGSSVTGRVDDRTDIACIPSGWLKGERGKRKARAAHNGDDHHGTRARPHRDRGWHRGHHRPFRCDASALTAGTTVREAELKVTASGLVFDDVELIKERAAG